VPLPTRQPLLPHQGRVHMGACPARGQALPESRSSLLPGHSWRRHPGSEHSIPRATSVARRPYRDPGLLPDLCTSHVSPRSNFSAPSPHSMSPATHPCQLLHCVASSVFQHMSLSQYGLNPSIPGGREQEESLHHQRVCVCRGGLSAIQKHKWFCSSWQRPAVLKLPFISGY